MGERSYWGGWRSGRSFSMSEGELSSGGGDRGLDESTSEAGRVGESERCVTQNGGLSV